MAKTLSLSRTTNPALEPDQEHSRPKNCVKTTSTSSEGSDHTSDQAVVYALHRNIFQSKDKDENIEDTRENECNLIHPFGDVLLEELEYRGMRQAELAERMDCSEETIREIIRAEAVITAEIASQLEQALDIKASLALRWDQDYRDALAQMAKSPHLEDWILWLEEIPIHEMMECGWIPKRTQKSEQVFEALKFFGEASPAVWQIGMECQTIGSGPNGIDRDTYRLALDYDVDDSFSQRILDLQLPTLAALPNRGAISALLRRGQLKAKELVCFAYCAGAFRNALRRIRVLIKEPMSVVLPQLVELCADAGVAVVLVEELSGTSLRGATQWLSEKAIMQFAQEHQNDERFWFTFFHQAGHIMLHQTDHIFLEPEPHGQTKEEKEADAFAWDLLMPPAEWQPFIAQKLYCTAAGIQAFAETIGLPPAMVIARLEDEDLQDEE